MKSTPLLLLLLVNVHTSEVHSQPYQTDGECLNPATEYKLDGSNLCCRKCQPGERLKEECSRSSETVCEPCPTGQYIQSLNYSPNCFPCKKCKFSKGFLYIQNCSAQAMSKCGCRPGMYCTMDFKDCSSCVRYRSCNVGYGVSKAGTDKSDVRCKPCPDGTFSDKDSSTEPCQPHQTCEGRAIRAGNATTDTVCQPGESFPTLAKVFATPTTDSAVTPAPSIGPSASEVFFNHSTKSLPAISISDENLALIIFIPVILLLLITGILLLFWKTVWAKVDSNGTCGAAEKETRPMSMNVAAPEQECLLEKSQPNTSDQSHSSRSTDILTENGSSSESIVPLQPALALHDLHSQASESMTLFSCKEALPPDNSVHAQSSQPTTPQIISPVTSPHVNVNITFHIGDRSGGATKVSPTDLEVDPQLPFGEEEEALCILQQEGGKQFVMAVQESLDRARQETPAGDI